MNPESLNEGKHVSEGGICRLSARMGCAQRAEKSLAPAAVQTYLHDDLAVGYHHGHASKQRLQVLRQLLAARVSRVPGPPDTRASGSLPLHQRPTCRGPQEPPDTYVLPGFQPSAPQTTFPNAPCYLTRNPRAKPTLHITCSRVSDTPRDTYAPGLPASHQTPKWTRVTKFPPATRV